MIGYTYIVANKPYGTLYVGVTSDIVRRVYQHRTGAGSRFTSKYGVAQLVWFEEYTSISDAILREKQLKPWRRDWKIELIEAENPHWCDLYPAIARP